MLVQRIAISAVLVAGLAALPVSAARAQPYYPCNPFPLFWPFCAAAAIVGTAGMIVTAPLRAAAAPPYYYAPRAYYPPPPAYPPPPYYGAPYPR